MVVETSALMENFSTGGMPAKDTKRQAKTKEKNKADYVEGIAVGVGNQGAKKRKKQGEQRGISEHKRRQPKRRKRRGGEQRSLSKAGKTGGEKEKCKVQQD